MSRRDRIGPQVDRLITDMVTNGAGWSDQAVYDRLEQIGRLATKLPKAPRPETALNRSARRRLEMLAREKDGK